MSHDQLRFPVEGDPATYVIDGLLIHGRVVDSHDLYRDVIPIRRRDTGGNVRQCLVVVSEKGLTWCYGHVTEKDDKGQALLAAHALTRTPLRRPFLKFDDDTTTVALRGLSFPLDSHGHAQDLPAVPAPDDRFHIEVAERMIDQRGLVHLHPTAFTAGVP